MATAHIAVFIATGGRVDNGADELRLIVRNLDSTRESVLQEYTAEQLIQLVRMQLQSGWDFGLDQWTDRQRNQALLGIVPQWDDNEVPIYTDRLKIKPRK